MSDYNLAGLSSRSFEQLIQAISVKVIGPDIIIFGDGPDGGREATLDGSIPYPDKDNKWQGYGVVQAKFRQRPRDVKKDGDWALDQLRSEFKKFTDPEKKLRKPEYYIFATNIVLTPVYEKGTKDKAYNIIKEYKKKLPLKNFDIWDYDKICAFLDNNKDIRHSYAAWITTGDVLSKVMKWIEPRAPDFEQIIANYLQKELLADQYANLEQAGHAAEDRIPLANVFVDLPVTDQLSIDPSDQFGALVHARLKEEGHEGEELKVLKQRIIEAATHRLVFLVGLEAGKVGFEIRSLQEFTAAEELMEGSDEIVRDRLREIAPVINWRNVFLIYRTVS